jgi:hypothetical protein
MDLFAREIDMTPDASILHEGVAGQNRQCGMPIRFEQRRRECCLFSIDVHFPKLDVAGSIPVSRSFVFNQ